MVTTVTMTTLLMMMSANIQGSQVTNQTGWTCVNSFCYLVVYNPKSWYEAVVDCINRGSDLLSVTNQQEQRLVEGLIKHTPEHYWIGASDFHGNWSWADKSDFKFANWAPGEPNNANGREHCVGIWPLQSNRWNDFICNITTNYICKRGEDPCSNHICFNNGSCYVLPNTCSPVHACRCVPGYDENSDCQIEINECSSNPCQYGTCVDALNHYVCVCNPGYTGIHCEQDIDECTFSGCLNGTCVDKVNGFICHCYPGFTGKLCEIDIDECSSSPCYHGVCIDRVNGFHCSCGSRYKGEHCDQEIKNDGFNLLILVSVLLGIIILLLLMVITYLLIKHKTCRNKAGDKRQGKQQPNQVKKKQIEPISNSNEPWDPRTNHLKELSLGPSSRAIRGLEF